jgi:rRNA small subunit pseudouridine methyltransferase Nep1
MLHLILADAELETVPPEIASDRTIRWQARRRGRRPTELLLDSNYHYVAMRRLPEADRRGRPDIVHLCLLLALDSPLNREGLLRLYVHTRHDKLVTVDPATRIPRAQNRFAGLLEQLFLIGAVPPERPLLRIEDSSLSDIVRRIGAPKVITFTESGERKPYEELFRGLGGDDEVCVIVGAFPHGDFRSDVVGLSDELVCADPERLEAATVVTRTIYAYEEALSIQKKRLGVS